MATYICFVRLYKLFDVGGFGDSLVESGFLGGFIGGGVGLCV